MWAHFMWRALCILVSSTALFPEQYKKPNFYKGSQIRQMIEFEDHLLKPSLLRVIIIKDARNVYSHVCDFHDGQDICHIRDVERQSVMPIIFN
jgi:hypothetical protein